MTARRIRVRAEMAHPCQQSDDCYADPKSDDAAKVCHRGMGPRPTGAYHSYRTERQNERVQRGRAAKYGAYAAMDVEELEDELKNL
jgi:hypothetical protein